LSLYAFLPKKALGYEADSHLLEDSGLVFMQKLIKEELDVEEALSDAWLQEN